MRNRIKTVRFYQIVFSVLILAFHAPLFAQNQTMVTNPDNLPLIQEIEDGQVEKIWNSPKSGGVRLSTASLTSGCKAVETGDSAAFSVALISYKNHLIPVKDVAASWMPPAPINPDATINGVDSDGDCVRDDIERYIGMLFREKDDQRIRKYLFEYAKWLGIFIKISHWSVETSQHISTEQYKATRCIRYLLGGELEITKMIDRVFANFHNTLSRSKRYIHNNKRLGGWNTRKGINVGCP